VFEACLAPILKSVVAARGDAVTWLRSYAPRRGGARADTLPGPVRERREAASGPASSERARISLIVNAGVDVSRPYLEGVVVRGRGVALSVIERASASRVATLDGVFFDGPGRVLVAGTEDIDPPCSRCHQARGARALAAAAQARETEAHEKRAAIMASPRTHAGRDGLAAHRAVAEERAFEGVRRASRSGAQPRAREGEITALENGHAETRDPCCSSKPKLERSRRTAGMPDAAANLDSADLAALEESATRAERETRTPAEGSERDALEQLAASNEAEAAEPRCASEKLPKVRWCESAGPARAEQSALPIVRPASRRCATRVSRPRLVDAASCSRRIASLLPAGVRVRARPGGGFFQRCQVAESRLAAAIGHLGRATRRSSLA